MVLSRFLSPEHLAKIRFQNHKTATWMWFRARLGRGFSLQASTGSIYTDFPVTGASARHSESTMARRCFTPTAIHGVRGIRADRRSSGKYKSERVVFWKIMNNQISVCPSLVVALRSLRELPRAGLGADANAIGAEHVSMIQRSARPLREGEAGATANLRQRAMRQGSCRGPAPATANRRA